MNDPFIVKYADFTVTNVIDENNTFHKLMSVRVAKEMAQTAGLDLVCFNRPQKDKGALCKILDYGKWKYANDKELKKQKQQMKKDTKEIRLSPVIDTGDLDHKVSQIIGFLDEGCDVIVAMYFKGIHKKLFKDGETLLNSVVTRCKDHGTEQTRKKSGDNIALRLSR